MVTIPEFLNPDLAERFPDLQEKFAAEGKLIITDFLAPAFAERAYACLDKKVPWYFEKKGPPDGYKKLSYQQYKGLSGKARAALLPAKPSNPLDMRYAYEKFELLPETVQGSGNLYEDIIDLFVGIKSDAYVKFMIQLTGHNQVDRVGAQFSRYSAGHYLSPHDDDMPNSANVRLAAHVLCLTKNWQKEWGGCFCFCDKKGRSMERQVPSFNTLVIFNVPKLHYVSPIKKSVKQGRYSIFGWLEQPSELNKHTTQ